MAFAEVPGNVVYSINPIPGLVMVAERPLINSGLFLRSINPHSRSRTSSGDMQRPGSVNTWSQPAGVVVQCRGSSYMDAARVRASPEQEPLHLLVCLDRVMEIRFSPDSIS